jgi:hypothetical protein
MANAYDADAGAYDDLGEDEFAELHEDELPPEDDELPPEDEISVEARARAMGWKPKAEFRGDPARWTDAATFVEVAEQQLPVLRDQNRRMSERLARQDTELSSLRNSLEEQKRAVQDAINLARRSDQRGYDRALRELKERQREAVSAGDTEAYDQVEEQIQALEQTRAEVVEEAPMRAPPAAPPGPQPDPAIQSFVAANPWFTDGRRPALKAMMIAMHQAVLSEGRIADLPAQLAEAKRRTAAQFPDEPELQDGAPMSTPPRRPPPRRTAAPVAAPRGPVASRSQPGPRAGASPFDRLPSGERAEAQAAYARMKRADPGLTAEEYVAMYEDPHADVLALREQHRRK